MNMPELRQRIKETRQSHGLSQFDVAELVGVTQAFIARIESGAAKDISYSKAQRILNALKLGNAPSGKLREKRRDEIKQSLYASGLSLRSLATDLGIHHSTVSSVINGRGSSARVEKLVLDLTGLRPYKSSNKGAEE